MVHPIRVPETVYERAKELQDDREFSSLGDAVRYMCNQEEQFDV